MVRQHGLARGLGPALHVHRLLTAKIPDLPPLHLLLLLGIQEDISLKSPRLRERDTHPLVGAGGGHLIIQEGHVGDAGPDVGEEGLGGAAEGAAWEVHQLIRIHVDQPGGSSLSCQRSCTHSIKHLPGHVLRLGMDPNSREELLLRVVGPGAAGIIPTHPAPPPVSVLRGGLDQAHGGFKPLQLCLKLRLIPLVQEDINPLEPQSKMIAQPCLRPRCSDPGPRCHNRGTVVALGLGAGLRKVSHHRSCYGK
mmetsp:Transcript_11396/g.25100  ORF Transcript_11396/g.25100 Transcript_11396/m.25100 type:complete len:251 (-) Transcript_11396:33-785(-)